MDKFDKQSFELGEFYLDFYTGENKTGKNKDLVKLELSHFAQNMSARSAMGLVYDVLVKYKKMPRIEDLPQQQKQQWWDDIMIIGRHLSKHEKIRLTKALYALAMMAELEMQEK